MPKHLSTIIVTLISLISGSTICNAQELAYNDTEIIEQIVLLNSQRETLEREQGPWNYASAEILISLAQSRQALGDIDKAIELQLQALHIFKVHLGLYNTYNTNVLLSLFDLHLQQGDLISADERADYAEYIYNHLYDSTSSSDRRNLIHANDMLIKLRAKLNNQHSCYENHNDIYRRKSSTCKNMRDERTEHYVKATQLLIANIQLIKSEFGNENWLVYKHLGLLVEMADATSAMLRESLSLEDLKFQTNRTDPHYYERLARESQQRLQLYSRRQSVFTQISSN